MSTSTTSVSLLAEKIQPYSPEEVLSQHIACVQALVTTLIRNTPSAVTFTHIEVAMNEVGCNPSESDEVYQDIIDALEAHDIPVVETLEQDQQWADENASATELADEVWEMLRQTRAPLDAYQHPLLTADREHRLLEIYHDAQCAKQELSIEGSSVQRYAAARRVEAGIQALDELMRCNLRLVTRIAARHARYVQHLALDDLIQEGRIGLYKAIERFDLHLQLRLSTYATWWIRQAIERAVADRDRTIRLPVHVQESLRRLEQEREQWIINKNIEPTDEELADVLGFSIKKVQRLRAANERACSLDMPVSATGAIVLGDLIPDVMTYASSQIAESHALQEALAGCLKQLTAREREVLTLRFGLINGDRQTLESIGHTYGLTRERIRQIEVKALRKLRHPRLGKKLREFLT